MSQMAGDHAGLRCAGVSSLQPKHEDVPVGDAVVCEGVVSKAVLEFGGVAVEASYDDTSLAGDIRKRSWQSR